MAIDRPCLTGGDPAAVALYLQALAFDVEAQFSAAASGLAENTANPIAGQLTRITTNFVTNATASVPDQIFLDSAGNPTDDYLEFGDGDASGLWAYGFTVRCDPTGVKTLTTFRACSSLAGYTDNFGNFVQTARILDVQFESNSAALTRLNGSGTFVIPQGLGISFPTFNTGFTFSNAGSTMEILAQSTFWAYKVTGFNQIVVT